MRLAIGNDGQNSNAELFTASHYWNFCPKLLKKKSTLIIKVLLSEIKRFKHLVLKISSFVCKFVKSYRVLTHIYRGMTWTQGCL